MRLSSSLYTNNNRVVLVKGGRPYFDSLLQLIENAKEHLHLQTYIFGNDETARMVKDALVRAAGKKVKVYVLVDGYASQDFPKEWIQELEQAGAHFRFFEPLLKSTGFYFGRRLHHKVVVADAQQALVGGINIADRYNDMPGNPAWMDFAVLAEGEIASQLCTVCCRTWENFRRGKVAVNCNKTQPFSIPDDEKSQVRIRRNDWVRNKKQISLTYRQMFREAQSDILILSSYFLPGKSIRNQLKKAIQRGVRVRVIAAGVSDVPIAKQAERWLYDWLLRRGVTVYEYHDNILHGKLAVCDKTWMTIGSYNINNISAYASIELNLDIKDEKFASATREQLEAIIQNSCTEITNEQLALNRNVFRQFYRWCCYHTIRLLFFLFTFYFKQTG
jgi:cardiolipin synthase